MNINRDYLIINDVKKSNITLNNGGMFFYITDKNTQNIFVNLVINVSDNELIQKYANIENAEDYTLTMNIVKPDNTCKIVEGKLHDKEKAIYEFDLKEDCVDKVGTYTCELLTKCTINGREEITTSNKITYKVNSSILNDLDDIVEAPEYPLVIQLFDKLSDIDQYEEDRRANELARQLAEEQRQTRFDALDSDMVDRVNAMDSKIDDVENRISAKEQAVDKLIVDTKADIDEYKVAKDQEIDEYKTAKDQQIDQAITNQNNKIDDAIANQNNKIDTAVVEQNNRIEIVEASDNTQNTRLDALEAKDITHETSITNIEAKNVEQNNRLDSIEAVNVSQDNRLDAIEIKNQQQDDRLLDVEKINKKQDMDLKCLFAESKNNMIDVTEEGNSIYLQNSTMGYTLVDEIQGQTLVNCNKEPDKELTLMSEINVKGYSNITLNSGVDGGLVDVALEGNTMVNVCDQKDPVSLPFEEELTYLYPSTQYAVQFVSDKEVTVDITLGGAKLLAQSIVKALNKITITTPETLVDNKLMINGVGANIKEVVVTEAIDRDFGYFEGMKSVGECEDLEVVSSNKNLWDNDVYDIESSYGWSQLVKLNKNKTYKASYSSSSKTPYLRCYDEYKKVMLINESFSSGGKTISGASYISIQNFNSLTNIQLEEGNTVTDYIPHAHNTQTLTHEPLRAVGDIKDKYVLIDGKWYIERNTAEVVLEENNVLSQYKSFFDIGGFSLNNLKLQDVSCKCDKFKYASWPYKENYDECISTYTNSIRIYSKKYNSINQLKTLIREQGLTIIFRLQTPQYEPIDYNPFTVYSDVTHISNNSTIPCNMTIKNTGYNCLLKPNTTYTVSSNLGLNTVTTPSTLTEDCLRFYDTDTSTVTTMKNVMVLEGDYTTNDKPIPSHFSGIESCFEQEYDEVVGKYKVKVRVQNEDATKENYIEFYINEPLRGIGDVKDKVYVKDDKAVVERNCGQREYQDGDFGTYLTDKVNTVYQLAEPTYEEVEYNDIKLFIESFKNSTLFYNSNIPVVSTISYTYSVPLVDTVAQTASISDQQDSMIIDMATQVAVMEMMLM